MKTSQAWRFIALAFLRKVEDQTPTMVAGRYGVNKPLAKFGLCGAIRMLEINGSITYSQYVLMKGEVTTELLGQGVDKWSLSYAVLGPFDNKPIDRARGSLALMFAEIAKTEERRAAVNNAAVEILDRISAPEGIEALL